jgi:hypothetical protein
MIFATFASVSNFLSTAYLHPFVRAHPQSPPLRCQPACAQRRRAGRYREHLCIADPAHGGDIVHQALLLAPERFQFAELADGEPVGHPDGHAGGVRFGQARFDQGTAHPRIGEPRHTAAYGQGSGKTKQNAEHGHSSQGPALHHPSYLNACLFNNPLTWTHRAPPRR